MTKTLQLPVQPSTAKTQQKPITKQKVKLNLTSITSLIKDDSSALQTKKNALSYVPTFQPTKSRRDEIRLDNLLDEMEAQLNQGCQRHTSEQLHSRSYEEFVEHESNSTRSSIYGTEPSTDSASHFEDNDSIENWNIESVPLRKRMQRESGTYFMPPYRASHLG